LFAYGPADATASQTPSSAASFKTRLVLPFGYWLTQPVLHVRVLCKQHLQQSDRVKPSDSSKLLLAADVKLRVDVILPPGGADSHESRRGELDDVASRAVGSKCGT